MRALVFCDDAQLLLLDAAAAAASAAASLHLQPSRTRGGERAVEQVERLGHKGAARAAAVGEGELVEGVPIARRQKVDAHAVEAAAAREARRVVEQRLQVRRPRVPLHDHSTPRVPLHVPLRARVPLVHAQLPPPGRVVGDRLLGVLAAPPAAAAGCRGVAREASVDRPHHHKGGLLREAEDLDVLLPVEVALDGLLEQAAARHVRVERSLAPGAQPHLVVAVRVGEPQPARRLQRHARPLVADEHGARLEHAAADAGAARRLDACRRVLAHQHHATRQVTRLEHELRHAARHGPPRQRRERAVGRVGPVLDGRCEPQRRRLLPDKLLDGVLVDVRRV